MSNSACASKPLPNSNVSQLPQCNCCWNALESTNFSKKHRSPHTKTSSILKSASFWLRRRSNRLWLRFPTNGIFSTKLGPRCESRPSSAPRWRPEEEDATLSRNGAQDGQRDSREAIAPRGHLPSGHLCLSRKMPQMRPCRCCREAVPLLWGGVGEGWGTARRGRCQREAVPIHIPFSSLASLSILPTPSS